VEIITTHQKGPPRLGGGEKQRSSQGIVTLSALTASHEFRSEPSDDGRGDPLRSLLERNERDACEKIFGELRPISKQILTLRYKEDLTYDEIAKKLNIPVGTVRSRLHKAVGYFSRHLAEAKEAEQASHQRTPQGTSGRARAA
jgi:RNA polymerase sigma factor (sigma-70 family)